MRLLTLHDILVAWRDGAIVAKALDAMTAFDQEMSMYDDPAGPDRTG